MWCNIFFFFIICIFSFSLLNIFLRCLYLMVHNMLVYFYFLSCLCRYRSDAWSGHAVHCSGRKWDLLSGDEQDGGSEPGLPQSHRGPNQVSGPSRHAGLTTFTNLRNKTCSVVIYRLNMWMCLDREETEIIEGEVVEIQIDRPATGTVCLPLVILQTNLKPLHLEDFPSCGRKT